MQIILFHSEGNLDLKGSWRLKQIVDRVTFQSKNFYWVMDIALVKKINNFALTILVGVHRISEKEDINYIF